MADALFFESFPSGIGNFEAARFNYFVDITFS